MNNLLGNIIGISLTIVFIVVLLPLKDVILYPFGKNYKK